MALIYILLKRDIQVAVRSASGVLYPLLFFIMAVTLFPLALGSETALLQKIASGIIWVIALLASLLPLPSLFEEDYDDGTLEQLRLTGTLPSLIVITKIAAYWLLTILPLLLAVPVLSLMLALDAHAILMLMVSLLLGTPILCFINAMAAVLMLGARKGGGLMFLLALPLTIPVLIFGAAASTAETTTPLVGLVALLLVIAPISITLCAAAIKQK